jgi:hypothetical protein
MALLGFLFNVVSEALYYPLLCQCFVPDLARRTSETAAPLVDFLLSHNTSGAASKKQARYLLPVVIAIATILSSTSSLQGPVGILPHRLLRQRLDQGPREGWDNVDQLLAKLFEFTTLASPLKVDVISTIDILRLETWGNAGLQLRVPVALCLVLHCG